MSEVDIIKKRLERSIAARKQAESILESKALELYHTNEKLKELNASLEKQVKNRTEALRASKEKYEILVEKASDFIFNIDYNGFFTYVNETGLKTMGFSWEEVVGKPFLLFVEPDHHEQVATHYYKLRESGEAKSYFEFLAMKKNGEKVWIGQNVQSLKGVDGKKYFAAVAREISYQKELQKDLENAKKKAEKAQQAEKSFLANMSHEIRTPLNAIVGMSHLLGDTELNNEQREQLDILLSSANILQSLIADILDISKIDSGKLEVHNREFNIRSLISSLVKTIEVKIDAKPVTIVAEIDKSIKEILVGDELMINQILLNLIGNAEKFTHEGYIYVRLLEQSRTSEKINIYFEIEDTGIGIDQKYQHLIFDQFRQADNKIKETYGGTGLGLSITKKIIDILGGKIQLLSEKGKGSKFFFTLELGLTDKKIEQELVNPIKKSIYRDILQPVLIVEDNLMNLKYIKKLFEKWELKYDVANNGWEAYKKFKANHYSMIFMDLQMPIMDGYEATTYIREYENGASEISIIALTASTLLSKKAEALETGMTDFLAKPFNPNQLSDMIDKYIDRKEIDAESDELGCSVTAEYRYNPKLEVDFLLETYEDDYEYAAEMFDTFLEINFDELDRLREKYNDKDYSQVKSIAHKIKPTFKMVGLGELSIDLERIEKFASGEELEKLNTSIRQFFSEVDSGMKLVKEELAALNRFIKTKG